MTTTTLSPREQRDALRALIWTWRSLRRCYGPDRAITKTERCFLCAVSRSDVDAAEQILETMQRGLDPLRER
jgi:hypothetical protein